MTKESEFIFDIEEPSRAFTKHLNVSFNERIILSAPFGAGKTYFLKEYFKRNNDKYETIHLFPVNYSVASNKDIFELIKYDILFELFGKGVEFEKIDFDELDFLPFYLKDYKVSALETLTPLLAFIPKVGKTVADFSEQLLSFYKKFEKKFNKIQIDDKEAALHYLESFNKEKGSVYEDDFYSQLIRQLVNQIKIINDKGEQEKETVLIIDDLDRIDPEHIFRILNVLSAHMDKVAGENKFGFDKIILVFDQHNVRNIFKNRYGTDVDFTGYIDKFYSHKIFEFSNSEGLRRRLVELLNSMGVEDIDFTHDREAIKGMVLICEALIETYTLTTRRLLKTLYRKPDSFFDETLKKIPGTNLYFKESDHLIFILVRLLLYIYKDWDTLIESVDMVIKTGYYDEKNGLFLMYYIVEHSLSILEAEEHKFEDEGIEHSFTHTKCGLKLKYKFIHEWSGGYKCKIESIQDVSVENKKVWYVLRDTLVKIKNLNLLGIE